MKTKTNVNIPFNGFYDTNESDQARENCLAHWLDTTEKDPHQDESELTEAEADAFNDYYCLKHKEFEMEVVKDYLAEYLPEYMTPSNIIIDSPREYNFGTDRIFCDIDTEQLIKMYNRIDQKDLARVIKEMFTSYDGFISFYSADINDPEWQDPAKYDHNQWNAVFSALNYNE